SWNKGAERIFGYTTKEVVGKSVTILIPPNRIDEEPQILARIRSGQKVDHYETVRRQKDGSLIDISLTVSPLRDRAGRIIGASKIARDISDRKEADRRLLASEKKLQDLLAAIPAAVYTTDAEGKITYFNQAAVAFSGRIPTIGSDDWCVSWKLYWPDGTFLPHDECPMATALKEGRPVRGVEAVAERPDGTRVPFIPYPTPLRDADGVITGAVNMLVDVSERKQSEVNQRVLLDELNHRVKNNMQMLHSLLRTAQRETDDVNARAVLANATDRIGAMAAAQQVLYDAGATMGYSARQFLGAVCDSARQALGENIRLDVADCDVEMLSNDTAMPLALIIHELIINAAKHGINGRGEGSIRVGLTRNGKSYSLSVEDDGPGFVLEQVRKRSSGLGLVFGLARQLGGTVKVEKDAGARCVVEFAEMGL